MVAACLYLKPEIDECVVGCAVKRHVADEEQHRCPCVGKRAADCLMVPESIPDSVPEPRVDRSREKKSDGKRQVGSRSEEQNEHLEGLRGYIAEAVFSVPDEPIQH